jgi:hypothetical protein
MAKPINTLSSGLWPPDYESSPRLQNPQALRQCNDASRQVFERMFSHKEIHESSCPHRSKPPCIRSKCAPQFSEHFRIARET